jgi:Phosphatidylethanolamine-binding protein
MQAEWRDHVSQAPSVRIPRSEQCPLVSWVLYDMDAPNPYDRHDAPFLHYMKTNVACTRSSMQEVCHLGEVHGQEVAAYLPPTPANNIPHAFHIEVLGHRRPVRAGVERDLLASTGRTKFALDAFKQRNGMQTLYSGAFMNNGKSTPKRALS